MLLCLQKQETKGTMYHQYASNLNIQTEGLIRI